MTALSTVSFGAASDGTQGDTVRAAFTKVNSNTAVLAAQATLTSAAITTARPLLAADIGKRLNVLLSANGTLNLPQASTCVVDSVVLLHNVSTTSVITVAVTTGSGDTVPTIVTIYPGEAVTYETDGASIWRTLARKKSLNETVQGALSVAGALSVIGAITGGSLAIGTVAAISASGAYSGASASYTGNVTVGGVVVYADASTQGSAAPRRNLLRNSRFLINQRGYTSGAATTAATQYTLDRWRVVTSGQSVSWASSGNSNQITAPAGGIEQPILSADLVAGKYCISWTGTATCIVNGTAVANGAVVTIAAATNMVVRFVGGTVLDPQVVQGSYSAPVEPLVYADELALCQFYYRRIGSTEMMYQIASQNVFKTYPLQPPMRIAPTPTTVTQGSVSGTTALPTYYAVASYLQINATKDSNAGMVYWTGMIIGLDAEV